MAEKLFELSQCDFNLSGVKQLYFAEVSSYPISIQLTGTSLNTPLITDINESFTWYQVVDTDDVLYDESFIEDRNGKYYQNTMQFTVPRVNPTNNVFFDTTVSNGTFNRVASKFLVFVFEDNNDKWYITGYNQPFRLESFELSLDQQTYVVNYISNSNSRARRILESYVESDIRVANLS